MKVLVFGAGVLGSLFAARLHEAGNDVELLARGNRLAALREHGVQLAQGSGPVHRVAVPIVAEPRSPYDLVLVLVRTHQLDDVLPTLSGLESDVLFLLNHAAGVEPLAAAIGRERVLLGFPTAGGVLDGAVVRYTSPKLLARLVAMPVGEPDGVASPRLERAVSMFRAAGFNARAERAMDAWLITHAAFVAPLGRAAERAGGPGPLAADPSAIRTMVQAIRRHLGAIPTRPVPRGFAILLTVPEGLLVAVFRRFLATPTAALGLDTGSVAAIAELDRLEQQLLARETERPGR